MTNCCQRVQKWEQARPVCGDSPPLEALKGIISTAASHSPEVLTDPCRCFPWMLPCQGSEARAGEVASRGLLRKGRGKNRTAEEQYVRYQRRSKQFGTRLATRSRKLWFMSRDAFKKLVPQQGKRKRRV